MPKGYRLPDTVDPEDTACMKLYYPNAPEYLAAIWGTLGYLTQWTAWERDSSGSAAAAAALWKDAIEFSRAEFEAERLCNYEAEPEYPASDDGSEELADFLWATKVIIEQIDTILDAGGTYLEFRTWSLDTFGVYVGDTFSGLWDDMDGMTSTERDNAIAAIPWQDAYDGTYCEEIPICGEGTYVTQYYCWGQAIIDALSDTAADLMDDILVASSQAYDALKDAMGGYTVKPFSNAFHGYGSNFSFTEPQCIGTLVYDFSGGSQQGWSLDLPGDCGIWTGAGWTNDWPTVTYDGVAIDCDIGDHNVVEVRVYVNPTLTGPNPAARAYELPGYSLLGQEFGELSVYTLPMTWDSTGKELNVFLDASIGGNYDFDNVLWKIEVDYEL